jgi:hypothetical protein
MAALAADLALITGEAGGVPVCTLPMRASVADTFYKGAICTYNASGQITCTAAADLEVAGICMENKVITAANQMVLIAWRGLFKFSCTAFTIANQGALFYALVTSDNPADLTATATGNTAAVGMLLQVDDDAVNGWMFIDAARKAVSAT